MPVLTDAFVRKKRYWWP